MVTGDRGTDPVPRLTQDRQHIGEVLLALAVVRTHLAERVREQLPVEREHPGVDLPDRALLLCGVLVLDDLGDRTGRRVADDPSVPGGVGDLGAEHGDGVGVGGVGGGERGERLAGQQRGVAADHDDGALDGPAQLVEPDAHRVPGALLLGLVGGAHLGVRGGEVGGDLLARVADDHDEVLGRQLAGGRDDMSDERAPGDLVQNLGGLRLHAGALTRCEDDDGCRAFGAHGLALRLRVVDIRRIPGVFDRA